MPHFGSGGGAGTTNESPSELIRLWRSRLSTSDIGAAADASQRHHRRSCPPTPLEGVLSQQPKMSETQDVSSVGERRGSGDTNVTLPRQKSEIDEEREDSEQRDAPETPNSESASTPRCDEPQKNFAAAVPDAASSQPASATVAQQQQQQQQQIQQSRAGECNLLPVLVERLRSALELSCSSQSSEDPLPLEDSGVDSEEDLRLWSSSLAGASTGLGEPRHERAREHWLERQERRPKLDLKFLEDILLADIHTALARLQDTLRRVDLNTLTRYNAGLDPSNKLYLLRLISSLLAKLKVPEEAVAKPLESENRSHSGPRRRKNERHTISVTAEEIARARRCFEEKSSSESSPKVELERESEREGRIGPAGEGAPSSSAEPAEAKDQSALAKANLEIPMTFDKGALNDKCMKDAINQQQSLQSKSNRDLQKDGRSYDPPYDPPYDPLEEALAPPRRFDNFCKDDSALHEYQGRSAGAYYQQHSTAASKPNKFTAKKWKIKRANTIDIPNYLKLKSESPDHLQNGCFALRRPIEVGDRIVNGHQRVVPSFEPKTENDRKFLALISKNTDSNANNSSNPFKSFNYRQTTSVADKNWSNRFSHIKTNFESRESEREPRRKSSILDVKKKFESRDSSSEREALLISPAKVPYVTPYQKSNGFTHAPTSPFQKIEKSAAKPEPLSHYTKTGYLPQKNSMLQAKLKLFDQDSAKTAVLNTVVNNAVNNAEPQPRSKNKFTKPLENSFPTLHSTSKHTRGTQEGKLPSQDVEDGHLNYYSFCKQFAPFASGKTTASENNSNINLAKNKLLVNLTKDPIKAESFKTTQQESKNSSAKLDAASNLYDFAKQYSYHKPYDKESTMNIYENLTHQQDPVPYAQNEKANEVNAQFQNAHVPGSVEAHSRGVLLAGETSMQNVGVQTTHESNDRRPHKAELAKSSADLSREQAMMPQPRKLLNNVSVQTTSPNTVLPMHCTQASSNPNAASFQPPAHIQQSSKQLPVNVPNYSTYQRVHPHHYYNSSNLLEGENCHEANNHQVKEASHRVISQKLYNEFSKLPDKPVYPSISIPCEDKQSVEQPEEPAEEGKMSLSLHPSIYEEKPLADVIEENIENQDISSDGIVTRYTCAIATVSSSAESPSAGPPRSYEAVTPRIKEAQPRHFAETTSAASKLASEATLDEIQRHNMLQQSLIRRMQGEHRFSQEVAHPSFGTVGSNGQCYGSFPGRVNGGPKSETRAQEKINMFEEKRLKSREAFRPLNVPVNASAAKNRQASPIDSSDEYLMSCASKPSRNIVLSKSESWHQLAMARGAGGLQLPQSASGVQEKPPKPKSPSSLRLSKQFEASLASDNLRKMEEKVQRYFQSSSGGSQPGESKESVQPAKREPKSKRNLHSKKSINSLMRSHTMPHLYDERLFDELDVDTAFESIFKEATRSDNRH